MMYTGILLSYGTRKIFSKVCSPEVFLQTVEISTKKQVRRLNIYINVYGPLLKQGLNIQIDTKSSTLQTKTEWSWNTPPGLIEVGGQPKKTTPREEFNLPSQCIYKNSIVSHHRIPKFHKPGPSTNTTSRSKNRHQVSMHSLDPHRPRTWTIGISPGSTCTHRIHVWYIYLTLPTKILYKINHSYVMLCAKKK